MSTQSKQEKAEWPAAVVLERGDYTGLRLLTASADLSPHETEAYLPESRVRRLVEALATRNVKPTDDTIALAAFLLGREWLYGDEIRHALRRLGFDLPSSQWVVGRLTAMAKESAPRFERQGAVFQYRVTSFAKTGLRNAWPGFIGPNRPLPTPRRFDLTAIQPEE